MTIVSRHKLSGSTDFKQIKVAANSSPGTTIHAADASAIDEIWLKASNPDSSPYDLTIEWGGTGNPDDRMTIEIPAKSSFWVVKGECLTNSLVVKAFAGTANKILIGGYVNRITTA